MKSSLRIASLVGIILAAALVNGCGNAQSREARYVQHGQQYFNAGKYDKARVEFSNAAQIDPKDPNVRYLLGQVAEKVGDLRTAVGQYQAALAQDPKQAAARAALARIYLFAGLPAKALELVEPGLAINPKDAQLLTARGAARAQLGDAKAAMQDAQTALQLAPADAYAVALLSSLYRRSSQLDQAISVVQTGLQRLPNNVDLRVILADLEVAQHQPAAAEAQLKQVIALQPQAVLNRYRLARFYLQQHNTDAAARTLSDAVAAFPDNVDAKLQLVSFLYQQRGHEQAIAQAEQFTAREPNNDALQLTMGQFLVRSAQSDQAAKDFRAVIAHAGTDPDGLMARDRLAALSLAKRDVAGAQALIAQVLDKNPRDADALVMRSNVELANDDTANAIVDLRAVLRDQPNNGAVMRILAQAYRQNGEIDLAEETLRSAVQVGPKDSASRLDLARTLVNTGKADQAQPLLEQLAKEDPKDLQVLQLLFQAQFAQKQNAQAGATAQTIERLNPNRGLGYYLQGLTEEANKQPQVAEKQYEQALALEPAAGEPLMALVRLDLQRKQPDAALARLAQLLAKSPKDPIAHDLQGDVLMSQGKSAAAIGAYQAAVQVAPAWPPAYRSLAAAQLVAKQSDEALRTLQQGVQKTQDNKTLLTDLSGLYVRSGRPEDAIALYQDILSKNPHSLFAANNMAMLLVTYRHDSASLTQAEQLSEQLASLSLPTVIDTRGWVKFKSGDFHGAESLLQEAVDKAPNAPELRYHLAMAQLRSGESQAAQQNLQSALQSAQPFVGMDDARATLAQLHKGAASG